MKNNEFLTKKNILMRDIVFKSRLSFLEKENLKEKEVEEYLRISESDKHPLVKKYHKSKHFLKWAIKLLVPDFLVGHPSLWDNLKTLKKHPEFKPFRMAITAWLIFTLTIGSLGIYSLINAPISKASGITQITKDTDTDFNQGILNSTLVSGTGSSAVLKLNGSFGPDGTGYYKTVTINNSAGAELTNFPVLITIDTLALISAGKLQSNCADMRFTDFDQLTSLSYYLASGCNTTTTNVWVKVPSISATSYKTIYFYYKNASATDASNFNDTFTLPNVINGQLLWLKADALTANDGDLITTWTDSSSNNTSPTQATDTKKPTYKTNIINGNPVMRFDGNSDYYSVTLSNALILNSYSLFAVHRPTSTIYGMLMASNVPADNELLDMNYPSAGVIGTYQSGNIGGAYAFTSDTPLISEFISSGSTVATPYKNGTAQTPGTPKTSSGGAVWQIGAYFQATGSYWYTGDMAEIILYNSAISDLNRRLMEAYLSAKYGITISGTLSTVFGNETGVIPASGTWDSPVDSNIIDLGYNIGWGDGSSGSSIAFSTDFSAVSANATLTFYIKVAPTISALSSASYISLGTANSGTSFTKTKADLDSLGLGILENRYVQVKVSFSQTDVSTPLFDSLSISYVSDFPPAAPTNSSPSNGALNQNPTPTLTALAFSDDDAGSSHVASEWQVRNLSDATYASPIYNSGIDTSNLTSISIPSDTLLLNTTYFWHVRYKDELGAWSTYSPETAFTVGVTPITVVSVGATEYQSGETAKLTVQVQDADGTPVNSATTKITIYNPSNSAVVSGADMTYLTGSSGLYYYDYLIPASEGVYTYQVNAEYNGNTSYSSHAFHISPALNTIATLNTNLNTVNTNLNTANTNLNTANSNLSTVSTNLNTANSNISTINTNVNTTKETVSTVNTKVDTTNTKVDAVDTKVTSANTKLDTANSSLSSLTSNLDILLGAFIVTQSTVNDTSPLVTSFGTALLNATNNFYKNSVLTFTGGELKGQSRRISAYDGTTKNITIDPTLSLAPSNGDTFTIVAQNVRVEEVANNIATTTTDTNTKVTDIQTKVSDIQTKVNAISTKLDTVDTNLDTLGTNIEAIRTSQQSNFTTTLTSPVQVSSNTNYRAKLEITDYQSEPVDANTIPTITIYDSARVAVVSSATMTKNSTGIYEYIYLVPENATAGLWETVASVPIGSSTISKNSYWQVSGSPAQVLINSMTSLTVPTISANVTITNEGNNPFEYQYEWCVVNEQNKNCSDSIVHASAAKLIQAGKDFNPTLSLTVPNPGDYWFKVFVNFGSQTSAATRSFTAISGSNTNTNSGGGGVPIPVTSGSIEDVRNQLQLNAISLNKILGILGNVDPKTSGFKSLLSINEENTNSVKEIQNKLADLKAVSATIHQLADQKSTEPIIQTYMQFNSVELHFLITNPDTKEQTVHFKAFLPEEVKPENIMNANGLKVDFDTNANTYFVSGDITLGKKESIVKKVEMKDIWVFDEVELNLIKQQAIDIVKTLSNSQFESQGILLKGDIETTINMILSKQKDSYSSPQDHIVVYRENKDRVTKIQNEFDQLKNIVAQYNSSKSIVGNIGGIQTFTTYGIILAIIFGFGLLATVIFAMWRHQTNLTIEAMGLRRRGTHFEEDKDDEHQNGKRKI